ncbi:MAG: hypothetical protein J6M93_06715 [Succinivibrio sp.]|nr:hypothetical protein [Succinivibrio sp.]
MSLLNKTLLFLLLIPQFCGAVSLWETGELTYPSGETEESAFINTPADTQLQLVLCTKNASYPYRFTLLLPKPSPADMVIQVQVSSDTTTNTVYCEVVGNSLELQLDADLVMSLPESPNFSISFTREIAAYLVIPEVIEVPMTGVDFTLHKVAAECTARCLGNDYQCNASLVSSLLWPRDFYRNRKENSIDDLCTSYTDGMYKFKLSSACKFALDRFYAKEGVGPLSFLYNLFNTEGASFKKYESQWNKAVDLAPSGALDKDVYADGSEWYLLLYSLAGTKQVTALPNSFFEIKNAKDNPTTLVYDIDNRYEMEQLKYVSVLHRKLRSSVAATEQIDKALKAWGEFYREFIQDLPSIKQAQALRPLIYRKMLMRIWRLAGSPQGISLKKENAFRQGTGGKTITGSFLEAACSFFDGANGEQFFFASEDCIKGVNAKIRDNGFKTALYDEVLESWETFSKAWMKSEFYSDSIDDAVGEHELANLDMVMLSMFKIYGFGDYFLLRQCISSRDPDICDYESDRAYIGYKQELNNRLDAIAAVSQEDAKKLKNLCEMWEKYYDKLNDYLADLTAKGKLPLWRANFVRGLASTVQSGAILNVAYTHDEIIDDNGYD